LNLSSYRLEQSQKTKQTVAMQSLQSEPQEQSMVVSS